MKHRTLIGTLASALSLVAAMNDKVTAAPKQAVTPPSLSKLAQAIVMAPLPDGRLIAIVGQGLNAHEAVARYSSDGGRTWSDPKKLLRLATDMGVWGLHYALVDRRGELHLLSIRPMPKRRGKGPVRDAVRHLNHVGSANGRTSWKAPVLVRKGYHGSMLSAIALKSGRLVLPISYLTPRTWSNRGKGFDAFTDMGRFSSGVVYSDDGGDSWQQAALSNSKCRRLTSARMESSNRSRKRNLMEGSDASWLLLRTQLGRFFESFSQDGSVWSKPAPTSIYSSDSPPSLTRLKDGRIVMLWNNCLRFSYAQGGRHILHAAISEDEGSTCAATGKSHAIHSSTTHLPRTVITASRTRCPL